MSHSLLKPTVLTPEIQKKIVDMVLTGFPLRRACDASGLTYGTFKYWQRLWRDDDPLAHRFREFFEHLEEAIAVGEFGLWEKVHKGVNNWQANAWQLERRWPQRYGRRDRTPVTPQPDKPIEEMTEDEIQAFKAAVAGAD